MTADQFTEAHLAGALRRAGYVVESASDAADALERVCVAQPRCVILDVAGPILAKLAQECRSASPRACLSPFIFLHEQAKPRRGGGRLAKHDAWIRKPFTTDELVAHVGKFAGAVETAEPASVPPSVGPPAGTSALDGDLQHISMRTLSAMLQMERRSGVLRIRSGERAAKLVWREGKPTQGTVVGRRMRGMDALKTVVEWETGRFSFEAKTDVGADGWMPGELDRPNSVSTRRPEPS